MPTVIDPDGTTVMVVDPARNSQPLHGWSADTSSGVGLVGGRTISYADIYASQSSVAAAVDWFVWKTVLVPLKTYRRTGPDGERERLRPGDHPLADAIREPWERGSAAALIQHLLGPLLVHGNGLTQVQEGARGVIRFRPADWRVIRPVRDDPRRDTGPVRGWLETVDGATDKTLLLDESMHIAWWSPLGMFGVSPLRKLGTTLRIDNAAERWTTSTLARSFRPNGVVELDERFLGLEPNERQEIYDATAQRFRDSYGGADRAGHIPILPPGVTFKDAEITTAVEAQLIEQRKLDRETVAAVYQVPPPMIGILDRSTYNNIATLRQVAYTDGLAPPLVMIEEAINATVCRGLLREPDLFVEFDFGGVLRGDRLEEVKAIREAVATAALTPNEGRDLLNRPRSTNPAADELYLPANNLKPLGWDDDADNGAGA